MKTMGGKSLPNLNPSEYSLILTDAKTGIILTTEGKRDKVSGDPHWIFIFEHLTEAEEFAEKKVTEMKNLQCVISDAEGKFVKAYPPFTITENTKLDFGQNK